MTVYRKYRRLFHIKGTQYTWQYPDKVFVSSRLHDKFRDFCFKPISEVRSFAIKTPVTSKWKAELPPGTSINQLPNLDTLENSFKARLHDFKMKVKNAEQWALKSRWALINFAVATSWHRDSVL